MGFFTNSDNDQSATEAAVEREQSRRWASPLDVDNIDVFNRELKRSLKTIFDPNQWNGVFGGLKPLDKWDWWGNFQDGRSSSGLKSYPVPDTTDYKKCVNNDGLSVWDDKGWWRCLFPRAKIPARSDELSREEIESDSANKFGLFFKDYNSLMDWRLQVKRAVEESDREKRLEIEAKNVQDVWDAHNKDSDFDDRNDVIRTSKSVNFRTLENGDSEEFTEIHKVYSDGRKETRKFKKVFPADGREPVVEDITNDKNSGWIWNRK